MTSTIRRLCSHTLTTAEALFLSETNGMPEALILEVHEIESENKCPVCIVTDASLVGSGIQWTLRNTMWNETNTFEPKRTAQKKTCSVEMRSFVVTVGERGGEGRGAGVVIEEQKLQYGCTGL